MLKARLYIIRLLTGIFVLLTLIAVINRLIDPFWYYQDIEIKGINAVKTKVARFERHVKPQVLKREQPEAIILGSSFSEIGLNPTYTALTDQGRLRGYNFAFAGADWDLVQCYFDFALDHAPIARMVIGIHPGPLPRVDCTGKLPEIEAFSELKLLLSFRTLNASINTLFGQQDATPSHTREGMYFYSRNSPEDTAIRFHEYFSSRRYDQNCDLSSIAKNEPQPLSLDATFPTANTSLDLEGLRYLIRRATAQGIELRFFAYPAHIHSLEMDVLCGTYRNRWAALGAIARIPEMNNDNVQLWQFFAYNDYNGERIIGSEPVFWQDPGHFNFEFGNLMLDAMFAEKQTQSDIGRRVTTESLPSAYRNLLAERAAFIASHPDFLKELHNLFASHY